MDPPIEGTSSPSGATTSLNVSGNLQPPLFYEKEPAVVSDELRHAVKSDYAPQLEAIFNSQPWSGQNQPLDNRLIRALLFKIRDTPPQFLCPFPGICTQEQTHTTKAVEHIEKHLGHRGYVCDICHMTFLRANERENHRPRHERRLPIRCPKCGLEMVDTKNLPRHLTEFCPQREM